MLSKKYLMDAITAGERKIFPVVSLELDCLNNTVFNINYTIVAFKIMGNDSTYWINNNLSKKEFKNIKKLGEEK